MTSKIKNTSGERLSNQTNWSDNVSRAAATPLLTTLFLDGFKLPGNLRTFKNGFPKYKYQK